jgi:hypothetical protein
MQETLQKLESSALESASTTAALEEEAGALQRTVKTLQEELEEVLGQRDIAQAALQSTLLAEEYNAEASANIKQRVRLCAARLDWMRCARCAMDPACGVKLTGSDAPWGAAQNEDMRGQVRLARAKAKAQETAKAAKARAQEARAANETGTVKIRCGSL